MPLNDSLIYDVYVGLLRRHPESLAEWTEARACQSEFELVSVLRQRGAYALLDESARERAKPLRTFIVSCAQDQERRANVTRQFSNRTEFDAEIVPGVDGRLPSFQNDYAGLYSERIGNLRTAGCFLSHRVCWQKVVDLNLPYALIVEDDFMLYENTENIQYIVGDHIEFDIVFCNERPTRIRKLARIPDTDLFVSVSEIYRRGREALGRDFDEQCHGGLLPPVGTDAYIISQSGARRLLLHDSKAAVSFHADFYLWFRCLLVSDILGGDNASFVRLLVKYHGLNLPKLRGYVVNHPLGGESPHLPSVRKAG